MSGKAHLRHSRLAGDLWAKADRPADGTDRGILARGSFGDLAKGLVKAPDDLWRITTDAGTTIEAPVIIAAGGGSFVPKKPLLENLDTYEGESVFYALRKTGAFRGKRVVIAGGGDSTLDWTLRLQPIAEQVMLLHHREGFRAAPHYYDYGKPKLWEAKRH